MNVNDRIEIAATEQQGVVTEVPQKADGIWAEQYVVVRLDGSPFDVTVAESAVRRI